MTDFYADTSPKESDDLRHVWFTAFACATVSLRRWYPNDSADEDIEYRRRKEAKRLADKAVQDLALLDSDAKLKEIR